MVKKKIKDHEGTEFPSITALCEYYGIERKTFCQRIKRGWSLEDALTVEVCPSPLKSSLSEKERARLYFKKYYPQHKERLNAYSREYKEKNRDKVNAQAKEYYQRNLEKIKEYQKIYRNNPVNKLKAKEYQEKYREKKHLERENNHEEDRNAI